jgi:hypothetical protein
VVAVSFPKTPKPHEKEKMNLKINIKKIIRNKYNLPRRQNFLMKYYPI